MLSAPSASQALTIEATEGSVYSISATFTKSMPFNLPLANCCFTMGSKSKTGLRHDSMGDPCATINSAVLACMPDHAANNTANINTIFFFILLYV